MNSNKRFPKKLLSMITMIKNIDYGDKTSAQHHCNLLSNHCNQRSLGIFSDTSISFLLDKPKVSGYNYYMLPYSTIKHRNFGTLSSETCNGRIYPTIFV